MRDSISEVKNSVNVLTSELQENGKVSDKTSQTDNITTVIDHCSKGSNKERLVPLAMAKAEDQKSDKLQDQRNEPGSLQIEELCKKSQLVETRSNRSSVISETSSARRLLYLNAKALKEQEELQARLEKLAREAKQLEGGAKEKEIADLHEQLARKARIAEKGIELAEASTSQGTSFRNISPVDSFREDLGWMNKTKTVENGAKYQYIRRQRMQ